MNLLRHETTAARPGTFGGNTLLKSNRTSALSDGVSFMFAGWDQKKNRNQSEAAFTLVGLVMVLGTIGLLLILLIGLTRAGKIAQQAACYKNLRQIGMGVSMYSQDNRQLLPLCKNWGRAWGTLGVPPDARKDNVWLPELLHRYLGSSQRDMRMFTCPASYKKPPQPGKARLGSYTANGSNSYIWNHYYTTNGVISTRRVSGRHENDVKDASKAPLVWDIPFWDVFYRPHRFGLNVLYLDGHVGYDKGNPSEPVGWWRVHSGEGWE